MVQPITQADLEKRRKYIRNYMRRKYKENPEKAIKYKRDYNNRNPGKKFRWQVIAQLRRDGVPQSEIEKAIVRRQSFEKQCPICKVQETDEIKPKWNIDHCHATKIFRDILCWKCNAALGLINDNITILQAMIEYIQRFKTSENLEK